MRRWIVGLSLLGLVACDGGGLTNQIIKEAKSAFDDQSYQQAVSLLKLASDESSKKEYSIWYEQGEAFLEMVSHGNLIEFDELLMSWTELNLVDSQPSFIKDEAVNYIKSQLNKVKELALEVSEDEDAQGVIELIRLIEKRLGTLGVFDQEIEELVFLKQELEG